MEKFWRKKRRLNCHVNYLLTIATGKIQVNLKSFRLPVENNALHFVWRLSNMRAHEQSGRELTFIDFVKISYYIGVCSFNVNKLPERVPGAAVVLSAFVHTIKALE